MKANKIAFLSILGTLAASIGVACTFANQVKVKAADTYAYVGKIDSTCSVDMFGGVYSGAVTTLDGDELYIDIDNGFDEEGYFVGLNTDGKLNFTSHPVKGVKKITIKGDGEMCLIGSNDPTGETITFLKDFEMDNSEITIDVGVGFDYFVFGAKTASYFEEITLYCSCSFTEINDEYTNITTYEYSHAGDFRLVDDFTNNSQVALEINVSAFKNMKVYLTFDEINLNLYDICFDVYSTSGVGLFIAEAHKSNSATSAYDQKMDVAALEWETHTLSSIDTSASEIDFYIDVSTDCTVYIDNIRAVAK